MGPQLIQWYFCQLVIKYAIRRDTPCSKADTLLRLRGARSRLRTGGISFSVRLRTGGISFSVLIITKLAGVGKLLRLRGARNHFQEGSIFFYSNLAS